MTYLEEGEEEQEEQQGEKKKKKSRNSNEGGGGNTKTLQEMTKEKEKEEERIQDDPFKKPKLLWDVGDVIHVIEKYGAGKAKELMLSHDFSEDDIMKALYFYMLSKQKDLSHSLGDSDGDNLKEKEKKPSSFSGSGFSL